MAIAQQAPLPSMGAPVTRLGSLFIAAKNPARRLINATINATIDAFCECSAGLLESRKHDEEHDAYLRNVDRLARNGIKNAMVKDCGCAHTFVAIGIDNGKAMVADQREDSCIDVVLCLTRRWSMALEKALKLRKCSQRAGRGHS